jgi:hypothetical protein
MSFSTITWNFLIFVQKNFKGLMLQLEGVNIIWLPSGMETKEPPALDDTLLLWRWVTRLFMVSLGTQQVSSPKVTFPVKNGFMSDSAMIAVQ